MIISMKETIAKSTVSKNEWNTKEDTGKSIRNALCYICLKEPLGLKLHVCQTIKKNQTRYLSCYCC